jgi:hypothetical protein
MRPFACLIRSGFVCDRFEPPEDAELYGNGAVAESLPQKYFGSSNGCPISEDPEGLLSFMIMLPFACAGKSTCAIAVTARGYSPPAIKLNINRETIVGLISFNIYHLTLNVEN